MVLSVGHFIPRNRKGYALLMTTCKDMDKHIGVYLVGGEPTEEYINLKDKLHLINLYFVPFMENDRLAEYYKAADFFVLSTRKDVWRLVINEAMAYGLPIFTTDKWVAGVEMINGNGVVYPVNVNLGRAIEEWLFKDVTIICRRSIEIANNYMIEHMAGRYMAVLLSMEAYYSE